jgi:heme-degrading monooxygenase HmoA
MKFARIAIHDLAPGTVDFSIRHAEAGLLPLFRGLTGFISYAVYRVDDRSVASVSLWDNREAAEQGERFAQNWVKSNLPRALLASRVAIGEQAFEAEGPSLAADVEAAPPG